MQSTEKAKKKSFIIIVSLQVQSSFQSVPLGAGCIVSSLRSDPVIAGQAEIVLADYSLEEPELASLSVEKAGIVLAKRIGEIFNSQTPEKSIPEAKVLSENTGQGLIAVGFSVYVWNRSVFEAVAVVLRQTIPGIIVFAGGPEITATAGLKEPTGKYRIDDKTIMATPFDYLICGEGESATRTLIRALLSGEPVPPVITTKERNPPEDCATLPSPWLDGTLSGCSAVRDYHGALWELARGCPYACAYCYESKGEKKVRLFPLVRLEEELDWFVKSGIERVFVLDPTYNANRDRAIALLNLIAKKAKGIHFNFEVRAELLDRKLVSNFGRISCSLQIGLQSANPAALSLVNRPTNLKEFGKKIDLLNEAGIVFGLDLMYGLPGDTFAEFCKSLDYAISLYPNNLDIFRLSVLPGTALAEQAAGLGVIFAHTPPYQVNSTRGFSPDDIGHAAELAQACNIFYTQGRAVSWFLSALQPLRMRPSRFFREFFDDSCIGTTKRMAQQSETISHVEIEKKQLAFLEKKYREKHLSRLWSALRDIVRLNGAWSRALAEGETTKFRLEYHPDDLFCPEALDLEYFISAAEQAPCSLRVFPGRNGPQYQLL